MNCCCISSEIDGIVGVISIVCRTTEVTVSVVLPETAPDVAVTAAEPPSKAVARPLEPGALLIAATAVFDELHVTDAVRSWIELSE